METICLLPTHGLDDEHALAPGVHAREHRLHLDERNGHVEVLRALGVPHHAHVGDVEHAEVALICRQVPHTIMARYQTLVGQHVQLAALDDRAAKFHITI